MDSKPREEIDKIISRAESNSLAPEWQKSDYTAQILSLIAPELDKARKWDRVTRAYNSSPPCDCPEWDNEKAECMIETSHCPFDDVVAALEEES